MEKLEHFLGTVWLFLRPIVPEIGFVALVIGLSFVLLIDLNEGD